MEEEFIEILESSVQVYFDTSRFSISVELAKSCIEQAYESCNRIPVENIKYYREEDTPWSLPALLKCGNKLLDSIFLLNQTDEVKRAVPYLEPGDILSNNELREVVREQGLDFSFCLMYILFRSSPPKQNDEWPTILQKAYSFPHLPIEYFKNIISLDLKYFPSQLIKCLITDNMPIEFKNRINLGLPGYRYTNFIIKKVLEVDIERGNPVREYLIANFSRPCWSVHPCTRPNDFNDRYLSYQKELISFIRKHYTDATIKDGIKRKALPKDFKIITGLTNIYSWPSKAAYNDYILRDITGPNVNNQ